MDRAPSPYEDPSDRFFGLYERALGGQWTPDDIDWTLSTEMDPKARKSWAKILDLFYSLEALGLHVVSSMVHPVTRRVKDPNVKLYLGMQVADEARHTYVMEKYVSRIGERSKLKAYAHFFAYFANPTIYKTDSWFFSTLFSENTASAFTRMISESDAIDPLAKHIFQRIFKDEGRHLRFLHLAIPGVAETLSPGARTYIKYSQRTLLRFGKWAVEQYEDAAKDIGLSSKDLIERVCENLDSQYKRLGIDSVIPVSEILPKGMGV